MQYTFTYRRSVLSLHIVINRVGSGIQASVQRVALSERHAVAHKNF